MSVQLRKQIVVDKPLEVVYRYLADFTTTTDWDPATVQTVRIQGDGQVGTTYENTSRFLGRETRLTYQLVDLRPDERVQLRGENRTLIAVDTMTFRRTPSGVEVTYVADFAFKGASKLVAPLLRPTFARLGSQAEAGMRAALQRL